MTRYLVLENHGSKREDDTTFIRDGFHMFAFVLPVVWLVWNRLWLHAALMFAAMGLVAALLHQFAPFSAPAITGLVNFSLGLLTALEGPAWLVADREKYRATIKSVIIARNLREAEEIHAAELPVQALPPRARSRSFQPVSRTSLIPLTGT